MFIRIVGGLSLAAAATLASASIVESNVGQIAGGYIQEGNLYRSGNIIKTTTLSNAGQDEDTCRDLCTANSDCNAYAYVQENAFRKPICYQRMIALPNRGTTRAHGYSKVVSGTKTDWAMQLGFTPRANTRVTGANAMRSFVSQHDDPFECISVCKREGGCEASSFVPAQVAGKRSICVLYDAPGSLVSQPGVLSATSGKSAPVRRRQPSSDAPPVLSPPQRKIEIPRKIDPSKLAPAEEKAPKESEEPDHFPGEMHDPDAT